MKPAYGRYLRKNASGSHPAAVATAPVVLAPTLALMMTGKAERKDPPNPEAANNGTSAAIKDATSDNQTVRSVNIFVSPTGPGTDTVPWATPYIAPSYRFAGNKL